LPGGIDARLGGPLQGASEQVTTSVHGLRRAKAEDVAVRGGWGKRVRFGDEGDGAADGGALRDSKVAVGRAKLPLGSGGSPDP
jgi:hypothetical protein